MENYYYLVSGITLGIVVPALGNLIFSILNAIQLWNWRRKCINDFKQCGKPDNLYEQHKIFRQSQARLKAKLDDR